MRKSNLRLQAFSLVEISVVIIIIGILIAGVTQGTRLIDETRLKTARDLTVNSRINSMEQLVFWYEPTLVSSFSKADAVDGARVSQWNDNNPQSTTKLHAKAGQKTDTTKNTYNLTTGGTSGNTSGPTYAEDGINNLPTLRFVNSSSSFQYLAVDPTMKAAPQDSMTMFVVAMLRDTGYGFLLSGACLSSAGIGALCSPDHNFGLEINSGGVYIRVRPDAGGIMSSFSSNYYDPGFVRANGRPYIITIERNYGVAFTTYVNGNSAYHANSDIADSGEAITANPFKIGRDNASNESSNMDISELIFFSGAIKKSDRQAIEDYLGKKYNIPVMH